MSQIDANATREQIAQMERTFARKRAAANLRRAKERSRLSDERSAIDSNGTAWAYVVVDGSFARVCGCETSCESLVVPDMLDAYPVREIDAEALSDLETPREIVCAAGIEGVGRYAFRGCVNLRRLVLPAETSTYSSSWVARCPNMQQLVLPGKLETIVADVLACPSVRVLEIGACTQSVAPGAFAKSQLREVRIDDRNMHLATDGICIYSADRTRLVAMACRQARYEVAAGCSIVGEKAFYGARELEHVVLPEGLQSVGPFAFASSGVVSLHCPQSLVDIAPKAFLRCHALREASLNEGLRSIGEEAFAGSALEALHVPASVANLGRSVAERTQVRHAGVDATFCVDAGNQRYFLDGQGCLYAHCPDGVHLAQMLEPSTVNYQVREQTVAIDEKAFAYHASIEAVTLPAGLKSIAAIDFDL